MHRTFLVGATPDDAGRDALALGVELARPVGAQVVLAGVNAGSWRPSWPFDHARDKLRRKLEDLRDSAPSDVTVSVEAICAESVQGGLRELAEDLDAQLLVLGPSHRGMLERALRGDLTANVVLTATCGVAVATSGQLAGAPRNIGVAWDETPEADEALEWAIQLAEQTGGTVRIVHVLEPDACSGVAAKLQIEGVLASLRQAVEHRAPAESRLMWGDPARVLADISHDLDLLVLGCRARRPVPRTLLGSVSTEVLHSAHCPVVVLPHGVHAPLDSAAI